MNKWDTGDVVEMRLPKQQFFSERRVKVSEAEYQQAMLERQEQLEEALLRAEDGYADEDDWNLIYFECGLRRNK